MSAAAVTIQRPLWVLIADDNPDMLEMLRLSGMRRGWHVDAVSSAEDVLTIVQARAETGREYDAVILDINFMGEPGHRMSGITAGARLRETFPTLPLLFLSAYAEVLNRGQVAALDGELFEKPNDMERIFNRVTEITCSRTDTYTGPERRNLPGAHRRRTDDVALIVPHALKVAQAEVRRRRRELTYE